MAYGIYYSDNLLRKYENIFKQLNNQMDFHDFLIEKSYDIIKDSGLFDTKFYFDYYKDVEILNLDPILHYLKFGVYEGCFPNPYFDSWEYLNANERELQGLNPFVHFILYRGGDIIVDSLQKINKNMIPKHNCFDIFDKLENKISLILPIYNAYEDTKKCIESIFKNTSVEFELILIDDKSSDSRISQLLDKYEDCPNVKVIRNKINQGFTKNVNLGLTQTKNDVILVNSDTMVTPRWIQKIIINAYSDDTIGTLTPFSNASDISVPNMNENNEIPSFLDLHTMSFLIEKSSANGNLIAPTGNGFCLFIKRDTINDIGLFDDKNFDKGYGEESDFTMRAKDNGWKNVRNDSIFIFHKRSASFSLNKTKELKKEHKQVLLKKYPDVFKLWEEFVNGEKLSKSIESIQNNIKNFNINLTKQNILGITDILNNKPNLEDKELLVQKYNIFLLTINGSELGFWVVNDNEDILINTFSLNLDFLDFNEINYNYLILYKTFNFDYLFVQPGKVSRFLEKYPNFNPHFFTSKLRIPILEFNKKV